MSLVVLTSGGLDSTLMHLLAREEGIETHPLFIDYGQRAREAEWRACRRVHEDLGLPIPIRMDLSDFGRFVPSGLTDPRREVVRDAFLPGRNLLFLIVACAYAVDHQSSSVAIGLLHEDDHLFPDQTSAFLRSVETTVAIAQERTIRIVAPLMQMHKADVVALAEMRGIHGTYSCHVGGEVPCGGCISCREFATSNSNKEA